jgi:hypothetical protein
MPPTKNSKIWDWAFKILSILIIPVVLWGVRLEVRIAVMDAEHTNSASKISDVKTELQARIVKLENDMEKKLKAAVDTSRAVETGMQENKVTLGRMEGKLDGINKDIDEIKGLLRTIR